MTISYEFVWMIRVGGSTADKRGVSEVDSCAAQMNLKQHKFTESNLYNCSDQI